MHHAFLIKKKSILLFCLCFVKEIEMKMGTLTSLFGLRAKEWKQKKPVKDKEGKNYIYFVKLRS